MLEHEVSKVRARAVVPCDEHADVSEASLVNERRCSEGRRDSVSLAHANVSSSSELRRRPSPFDNSTTQPQNSPAGSLRAGQKPVGPTDLPKRREKWVEKLEEMILFG
jgi:hypothetical protein